MRVCAQFSQRSTCPPSAAGVTPVDYAFMCVIADPSSQVRTDYHVYSVTRWSGEPALLGDEHVETAWFTFQEAARLSELALEEYRDLFNIHLFAAIRPPCEALLMLPQSPLPRSGLVQVILCDM